MYRRIFADNGLAADDTDLKRLLDACRVVDARNDRNALLLAVGNDLRVQAGADDEFCARFDGRINLLGRQDRSCADQKIRILFCHCSNGVMGSVGTVSDFRTGKAAFDQRVSQRQRVIRTIDLDDRNDSDQ